MAKSWYAIYNKNDGSSLIDISGDIGEGGVTSQNFIDDLNGLGDVVIRINSYGGDVFEGYRIGNEIKKHKGKTTASIEVLAASIASFIALSCDEIKVRGNSYLMGHNAISQKRGNMNDFRNLADNLESIQKPIFNIYAEKFTKLNDEEVQSMMDKETWMDVDMMKKVGLDIIEEMPALKVAAQVSKFNIPTKVSNIITMENNEEKVGVLDKVLNHIGNTKELKTELATSVENLTESVKEVADLKASLEEAEAKTVTAEAEVTEFKNLSEEETAKVTELQEQLAGVIAELEALKGEPAEEPTEPDASDVQNITNKVAPKVVNKKTLKGIMAIHNEKKNK